MYLAGSGAGKLASRLDVLALVAFAAIFFVVPPGANFWVLAGNLAVFYLLFFRAAAAPDRIVSDLPSYFSIEVLFLAFSYLIFYYPYQLYLVGATNLEVSFYVPYSFPDSSNNAITLSTVGMLAFTAGYRIKSQTGSDVGLHQEFANVSIRKNDCRNPSSPADFVAMATASSASLLLLMGLYLVKGWRSAGEGRYTGSTTDSIGVEGISVAILMFGMIVAALWVYAKAAGLQSPPLLNVGLMVSIGWAIRLLLVGDRSAFLMLALVLVGGYCTFLRATSRVVFLVGFGIWITIYNIIEVVRLTPNWYSTANIWEFLTESSPFQQSARESSFNITTMTLRATVETVPSVHGFMYGTFKLIQFSTIIPFSGRLYLPYLSPEYVQSSDMLSDIMLGPHATWNTGTNIISDAYLDFGMVGVIAVLFGLGCFAKAIRNYVASDPNNVRRVVIYLLTLALFAVLPRYAIDLPIRILAWAFIFSAFVGAAANRRRLHDVALPRSLRSRLNRMPASGRRSQ